MLCLGEAMLRLGGEVRLGEALLRLGGPERAKTLGSGSRRRSDLRLGVSIENEEKSPSSTLKPQCPKVPPRLRSVLNNYDYLLEFK